MKHAQMQTLFVAKQHSFKTSVRGDGKQGVKHQVEDNMHRMTGNCEMDQDGSEIHRVFYGMHRQAGPWANVRIAMVKRVKAVQGIRVQDAMYPIEIETFPHRNQEKDCDKPNGVGVKGDDPRPAICHGPPKQHFKG